MKYFHNMIHLALRKQTCVYSLDQSTIKDIMGNLLMLLPNLKKLTHLKIGYSFVKIFGWESALSFVENSLNLRQLEAHIYTNINKTSEIRERINNVIIGHLALTKLTIHQGDDLWIDLSSCRNLTHFTFRLYNRMDNSKYEQLCALLDNNLNLEMLNIDNVSHSNLQLIGKLMKLPKLKTLCLEICPFDADFHEDLPCHRNIKDLHFVSLQNIEVCCGKFENHAKFVAFLLARSPLLKEFSLKALYSNLTFYHTLFEEFALYDQIETFRIHGRLPHGIKLFIYNEISKMMNLNYFWLHSPNFCVDDVQKVCELTNLKL
uniref:Uncharacterized protein n=1 Tax=Romanomermis culicivorax TaxID=13658 RepID=A0A915JJC6_ROMCU